MSEMSLPLFLLLLLSLLWWFPTTFALKSFAVTQPVPSLNDPCLHVQRFDASCRLVARIQCERQIETKELSPVLDSNEEWETCAPFNCTLFVSWMWEVYCAERSNEGQVVYPVPNTTVNCQVVDQFTYHAECDRISVKFRLLKSATVFPANWRRRASWYPQGTPYEEEMALDWGQDANWMVNPDDRTCQNFFYWKHRYDTRMCPYQGELWRWRRELWTTDVITSTFIVATAVHFMTLQHRVDTVTLGRVVINYLMMMMAVYVFASFGWSTLCYVFSWGWLIAFFAGVSFQVYKCLRMGRRWRVPDRRQWDGWIYFVVTGLVLMAVAMVFSSWGTPERA